MRAHLHVIQGGRVIERPRDPESSAPWAAFFFAMAFCCLLIAFFWPIP